MITITDKAVKKILFLMERENKADHVFRIGVQGGGCVGFSYTMEFQPEAKENDTVHQIDDLTVVCDPKSLKFLEGIELYYDSNLLNGGLKFRNPNAKRVCSCGESFAV